MMTKGSSSGSVYIYKISDPTYERKITPSDGEVSDVFGNSVSISGDIIVVGSPYDDDNGSNSGSVYIYDISKESNEFGFEIKLNYFNGISGLIISISENIIILKSSSLSTKFYLIEIWKRKIPSKLSVGGSNPSWNATNIYFKPLFVAFFIEEKNIIKIKCKWTCFKPLLYLHFR